MAAIQSRALSSQVSVRRRCSQAQGSSSLTSIRLHSTKGGATWQSRRGSLAARAVAEEVAIAAPAESFSEVPAPPEDDGSVAGKTIIVTGAKTGLGVITAEVLALKGANVVMACRSEEKGLTAVKKVNFSLKEQRRRGEKEEGEQGSAVLGLVDLASLDSVRQFAVQIQDNFGHVDQLICNAGIMIPPHSYTKDGFESQFQVNHLSHYLLTRLLLPQLLKAPKRPTIVHLSSLAGESGSIKRGEFWEIAQCRPETYNPFQAYCQSKLAQVLFTVEMSRRYGEQVTVNAVHPGIVNTELFNRNVTPLVKSVMEPLSKLMEATGLVYSPERGAATSIYLATHPASVTSTGGYWADCAPRPANPIAFDREISAEWWEESAKAAGLENEN